MCSWSGKEESGGDTMKDRGVDLCVGGLGCSVPPTCLKNIWNREAWKKVMERSISCEEEAHRLTLSETYFKLFYL